ncbi:ORF 73 [Cryptosporidium bovis]|uniref:ORF 73 n=1 Tax=Cryptosporidium bovis TaxID=310047 RepID=UPI00351AAAA0|nr:ORF 73 [Cryptosporidium bovis]
MSESNVMYHPFQGYIESGIAEIEKSTRKIVEMETRKFEAYIDVLKDQMVSLSVLEERNESLQSEIACITEKLSLRELEMESKEKRIFELEKEACNSSKDKKNYEKELSKLVKEKQNLIKELSEMHSKLQVINIKNNQIEDDVDVVTSKGKKRTSQNNNVCVVEDVSNENAPFKKSRLRRLQNEDIQQVEPKKSITKESNNQKTEGVISKKGNKNNTGKMETNPLKSVLEKTNLGKIKPPTLKGRVVKAAEAANPSLLVSNYSLELKSMCDSEKVSSFRKSKSNKKTDSEKSCNEKKQKSIKKTSKLARIAKTPHYSENVLNSMKVSELKDICSEINLEINPKSKKLDIIKAILSFQGE